MSNIDEGILCDVVKRSAGSKTKQEDIVEIAGLKNDHDFVDRNGNRHKNGFLPQYLDQLKELLSKLIEERGTDCDLNDVCTSEITDMHALFSQIYNSEILDDCPLEEFNGDISGWDVSNVIDMESMFHSGHFNGDISNWDVSNVKDMSFMFAFSPFVQDISNWDVSNVKTFGGIFDRDGKQCPDTILKVLKKWAEINPNVESEIFEGLLCDVVKRSAGSKVRVEDENEQVIKNVVEAYIKLFVRKGDDYVNTESDFVSFVRDFYNDMRIETEMGDKRNWFDNGGMGDLIKYIRDNYYEISDKIDDLMDELDECDCSAGIAVGDVSGAGQLSLPGECGCCGSGDLPMPTGGVYHQVAPFGLFVKTIKKKKRKKFRKEDEPCACKDNPKVYSHIDDFREYVDRTYDKIDKLK